MTTKNENGIVKFLEPGLRTLTLEGGHVFKLADKVDLDDFWVGDHVKVSFDDGTQPGQRVNATVMMDLPGATPELVTTTPKPAPPAQPKPAQLPQAAVPPKPAPAAAAVSPPSAPTPFPTVKK